DWSSDVCSSDLEPRFVHAGGALGDQSLEAVRLHRLDERRKISIERRRVPDRFSQPRQDLLLEKLTPFLERFASEVLATQHYEIEQVVHDRRRRRAVVLKRVERRTALLVERDQLTVDHGVV